MSIPDSITRIENGMLSYCDNVTYLKLPQSIEYIGLSAFAGCKTLGEIECWIKNISDVEFTTSSYFNEVQAFEGIKSDCTWHVPEGCASAYKSQPWWISTWKVIDDIHSGINTPSQDDIVKLHISNGSLINEYSVNTTIDIFDVMGILVKRINVSSGILESVTLPVGIYIINGKKILMK